MKQSMPKPAPWLIGTRLLEKGNKHGTKSGYPGPDGKPIWTSYNGAKHTVVRIGSGFVDHYEGERYVHHAYSVLQSDDAARNRHTIAIDADHADRFEVILAEGTGVVKEGST